MRHVLPINNFPTCVALHKSHYFRADPEADRSNEQNEMKFGFAMAHENGEALTDTIEKTKRIEVKYSGVAKCHAKWASVKVTGFPG
jgi:hypothetical protein